MDWLNKKIYSVFENKMRLNVWLVGLWVAVVWFLGVFGFLRQTENLNFGKFFVFAGLLAYSSVFFYAFSLAREKAAPAFRSFLFPWLLFSIVHLCVQVSGATASPFYSSYFFLVFTVSLFSGFYPALGICFLISGNDILNCRLEESGWNNLLFMAGVWVALPLGRVLDFGKFKLKKIRRAGVSPAHKLPELIDEIPVLNPREQIVQTIKSLTKMLFDSQTSWNSLVVFEYQENSFVYWHGVSRHGELDPYTKIEFGEGILGWILKEKKIFMSEKLAESAKNVLPYYINCPKELGSLLGVPFFDEGNLAGCVVVDRLEDGEFAAENAEILRSLGNLIVNKRQQLAYTATLQAKGNQFSKLHLISRELSKDMDRENLISRFPELLKEVVPFDSCYLVLKNENLNSFQPVFQQGYYDQFLIDFQLDKDTVLGNWVLEEGEPLRFNAFKHQLKIPDFLTRGLKEPAYSFLLVPLVLNKNIIGLLKLDRASENIFTESEQSLVSIVTAQAAVALEHARLYSMHKKQATTDGLTGLYNHRYFQERLAVELEQAGRLKKSLALFLMDIDHFKKFNDTFGHQEGDVVLKKVAQLLKKHSEPGNFIPCRYGGEEFVMILPGCDLVESRLIAEELRQDCATNLTGGDQNSTIAITLSIGISNFPQAALEQRELIHIADEALYLSKKNGRNRCSSFKDLP
jgi:diguanylate cyclase (GGDEF)-like protein